MNQREKKNGGPVAKPPGKYLGSYPLDFKKIPFLNIEIGPFWKKPYDDMDEIIGIQVRNFDSLVPFWTNLAYHSFKM